MVRLTKYIAVISEGIAEKTIIDILLDNDLLIFKRSDLIDGEVLRCRKAEDFASRYLRKQYSEKVSVLRIHDSRRENFKLPKLYRNQVEVINVITAPEIEMLIIFSENRYSDYCKTKMKPSEYCKIVLKMKNVKTKEFLQSYFSSVSKLVEAIQLYDKHKKRNKDEYTLMDLIR